MTGVAMHNNNQQATLLTAFCRQNRVLGAGGLCKPPQAAGPHPRKQGKMESTPKKTGLS